MKQGKGISQVARDSRGTAVVGRSVTSRGADRSGDAETLTDTNRMASLTVLLSEVVLEGLTLPIRLFHQRWCLRVVLPVSEC